VSVDLQSTLALKSWLHVRYEQRVSAELEAGKRKRYIHSGLGFQFMVVCLSLCIVIIWSGGTLWTVSINQSIYFV